MRLSTDGTRPATPYGAGDTPRRERVAAAGGAVSEGVNVSVNGDGAAVFDDELTHVEVTTGGDVTVDDLTDPPDAAHTSEFTLHDGAITIHNPAYVPGGDVPQTLTWVVPDEGIQLVLHNGTQVFISPNADRTLDVTVVNGDEFANFRRVGSGAAWHVGVNVLGSRSGAEACVDRWETTHDNSRHHGLPGRAWVNSVFAPATTGPHSHDGPKPQATLERDPSRR